MALNIYDKPKSSLLTPKSTILPKTPTPTVTSPTTNTSTPVPTISPVVITSKNATDDLNKIKSTVSEVNTGLQTQAQKLAQEKAKADADAKLKADADAKLKLEADKIAADKAAADAKNKALGGSTVAVPTDPTFVGQINHHPDAIKSVVTNPDGTRTVYYQDGTQQNVAKDPNAPRTLDSAEKQLEDTSLKFEAEGKRVSDLITNIQNGSVPLSAGEQAQVDGLKQQFMRLIEEQKLTNIGAQGTANIRGYQTGAGEYDPTFQTKTIGSIITAGINKVGDLNIKMASSIAELTQGFRDNNIKNIKAAWDVYSEAAKERTDTLKETIQNTQKAIEEARKAKAESEKAYYEQVEKPITEIAKEAAKNGATPEQLAEIQNAATVGDAVVAAGELLEEGTGIVAEYLYYKKEARKAGQVPASFEAYQNADANRKKSIARAGASGGGSGGGIYDQLDYRTANAVIAQGNSFGTSDIVKKYNNIVAASNLIRGVDPNTKNPAEHQAVIYNFAKALDPDSVVREGEYATVKKYSQSLVDKYGGEIRQAISGTGFLSPAAIKAIQTATDNRIKAYEPQYKNLRNETARRINSIAGKDVADTVLLDYDQGYSGNVGSGLIQNETQAKEKVIAVSKANPKAAAAIAPLLSQYSYSDIMQALPELFK